MLGAGFLGSEYYEEGQGDNVPDVVLYGVNPFHEVNDAQRTVHEFGHGAESFSHPPVYPEYKGKIVKGVRRFGESHARKAHKAFMRRGEEEEEEEEEENMPEEEEEMTEEEMLEQALQEIAPSKPPPAPPAPTIRNRIAQAKADAIKLSSIGDFQGFISHANIGVRIEDLTEKEMRALDLYVARAIRLWLKLRGKKRFFRTNVGGIKLKRGKIFGSEKQREEKRNAAHASALELLRKYRAKSKDSEAALPAERITSSSSRKELYDNFYNAMGTDPHLNTVTKGSVDSGIYHIGLGQRMYTKFYGMDPQTYKDREQDALKHFNEKYGLPFAEFGSPRDEIDEKKGTLCLFPENDKTQMPYAIFSNYLMNPRYSSTVVSVSSVLGSGLKGKYVTEAGWMVTINSEDGVALKGSYNKTASDHSQMFFSDLHVPTKGTSTLGDDGIIGSPISVHLESTKPSISDGGLDQYIKFDVSRVVDNGDTLGVSIKTATREVEVNDGTVIINSQYIL